MSVDLTMQNSSLTKQFPVEKKSSFPWQFTVPPINWKVALFLRKRELVLPFTVGTATVTGKNRGLRKQVQKVVSQCQSIHSARMKGQIKTSEDSLGDAEK